MLNHAEHEEREEFPRIRTAHDSARLKAMGIAVKAAGARAPTRPHPAVESAKENIVIGPCAAMMDRTRDVIRQAVRRGD